MITFSKSGTCKRGGGGGGVRGGAEHIKYVVFSDDLVRKILLASWFLSEYNWGYIWKSRKQAFVFVFQRVYKLLTSRLLFHGASPIPFGWLQFWQTSDKNILLDNKKCAPVGSNKTNQDLFCSAKGVRERSAFWGRTKVHKVEQRLVSSNWKWRWKLLRCQG